MIENSALGVANKQLDWYRTHKARARISHYTLELLALALSVLVTVAGIFKADPAVAAVAGAILVLFASLRGLGQWRENWIAWATAEGAIEQAIDYYTVGHKPYDGPDRDELLVRRVWEVRNSETEAFGKRKLAPQPTAHEPNASSGPDAPDGDLPPKNLDQ